MKDYSISWGYIVDRMCTKYDIEPDSTELMSFGEIEKYVEAIWSEFVDTTDGHED